MPTATLKAHYDGKQIILDEPFELSTDAPLEATVLAPNSEESEWASLGAQNLARAYGDDEPEYTTVDLREQ